MAPPIPNDEDFDYEDVEQQHDDTGDEGDDDESPEGGDTTPAAPGTKKKRKSVLNRVLQRWDPSVDQLILLVVDIVMAKTGRPVPWDVVAKHVNDHMTGEGIKQHLTKVTTARAEAGMVNPQKLPTSARRKENPELATAALSQAKKMVPTEHDAGWVPRDDKGKTPSYANAHTNDVKNPQLLHIPVQNQFTTKVAERYAKYVPNGGHGDEEDAAVKADGNVNGANPEVEMKTPVKKTTAKRSRTKTSASAPSKMVVLANGPKGGRKIDLNTNIANEDDDVFAAGTTATKKSTGKRSRTATSKKSKPKARKGSSSQDSDDDHDYSGSPSKKQKVVPLRAKRVNYNEQIDEDEEQEFNGAEGDGGVYLGGYQGPPPQRQENSGKIDGEGVAYLGEYQGPQQQVNGGSPGYMIMPANNSSPDLTPPRIGTYSVSPPSFNLSGQNKVSYPTTAATLSQPMYPPQAYLNHCGHSTFSTTEGTLVKSQFADYRDTLPFSNFGDNDSQGYNGVQSFAPPPPPHLQPHLQAPASQIYDHNGLPNMHQHEQSITHSQQSSFDSSLSGSHVSSFHGSPDAGMQHDIEQNYTNSQQYPQGALEPEQDGSAEVFEKAMPRMGHEENLGDFDGVLQQGMEHEMQGLEGFGMGLEELLAGEVIPELFSPGFLV